jgi:hypothetical protein
LFVWHIFNSEDINGLLLTTVVTAEKIGLFKSNSFYKYSSLSCLLRFLLLLLLLLRYHHHHALKNDVKLYS